MKNAEAAWGAFDSISYVEHNYRVLQAEDAEILTIVRDHFEGHFRNRVDDPVYGIDVGAGANLYPALSMLPWCHEIIQFERSPSNVDYLASQVGSYAKNWDQFWRVLCGNKGYGALGADPRARFREIVKVQQGDIFDLKRFAGRWSVGTMFFVAESMTSSLDEFTLGVECFMRALKSGAPFVAAFMEHSEGYHTGEQFFPACDVGESEVRESLEPFADGLKVQRLETEPAVRDGYSGMILSYGWRGNSDA